MPPQFNILLCPFVVYCMCCLLSVHWSTLLKYQMVEHHLASICEDLTLDISFTNGHHSLLKRVHFHLLSISISLLCVDLSHSLRINQFTFLFCSSDPCQFPWQHSFHFLTLSPSDSLYPSLFLRFSISLPLSLTDPFLCSLDLPQAFHLLSPSSILLIGRCRYRTVHANGGRVFLKDVNVLLNHLWNWNT